MYDELVERLRRRAVNLKEKFSRNAELLSELMQAADAIEELIRRCEQFQYTPPPAWIPVTERLPEDRTPVQVCYIGYYGKEIGSDLLACRYEGLWCYWDGEPCSYDECKVKITHWMPLPEPPKEEA